MKLPVPIARRKQAGFTIVELLIATLVFSVVLLLITYGVLAITRVYYRGVTETNTQNTARNIIETVSQSVQFYGGQVLRPATAPGAFVAGTSYAYCIGDQKISFVLGYQIADAPATGKFQSKHAMVLNLPAGGCATSSPQNLRGSGAINGRELLGANMRLSKFSIQPITGSTNLYKITVKVVYGDDDLLKSPATSTATQCNTVVKGTQFCAVSELSTVVEKRVE